MHYHAEIAANFQNMMQERENGSFFFKRLFWFSWGIKCPFLVQNSTVPFPTEKTISCSNKKIAVNDVYNLRNQII